MRISLTDKAHSLLRKFVLPGDTVIDATAGNGHDTLLLAERVGEAGRVFAFDNQSQAIASARVRLQQAGLDHRVTWLCHGHERMARHIPALHHGGIRAVVFNLGYLPGGDKSHVTQRSGTLPAVEQALGLLAPGGVLSIIAYTGHAGGRAEAGAVKRWAAALPNADCEITIPPSKNNNAPEWVVITRNQGPFRNKKRSGVNTE